VEALVVEEGTISVASWQIHHMPRQRTAGSGERDER